MMSSRHSTTDAARDSSGRRRRDDFDHDRHDDRRDSSHRRHNNAEHRERSDRHAPPAASTSSTSDRHRPAAAAHHQNHQRHNDDHHQQRREPRDREPRHNAFNQQLKREQSRSPDTKAKRHRQRYGTDAGDDGTYEWGKPAAAAASGASSSSSSKPAAAAAAAPIEKELPNFGLSGKLTEDTNKVNGVVLKYAEPEEARRPKRRWRLYPFKGQEALPTLFIHRQSCYLVGRDRKICDIPVDHPSCSKQHAVLQFRLVGYQREDGTKGKRVRPYVLDLESANGTYLNNQRLEAKRYVEVLEKDVLKFGYSSREYVMLHENSKDEEEDDDVQEGEPEAAEAAAAERRRK